MASTADLIKTAVERFQAEVPALQNLKLVFGLELKARHDIQLYRVEVPGPKISKDLAQDERILVEIDRPQFNELAEKGTLKSYRKAYETGHIKATGDSNVRKLIAQVVEKQEQRAAPRAPQPAARIASAPSNQRRVQPMSETYELTTDQAEREASGAHRYGRYLEEFEVGAVYKHWPAKTVTEADDHLFCLITMNHHPLHLNDVYAKDSQQGRNVVVGPLVYSLALGMSVSDVSGKAIANLATEELSHPNPVFHGDTLFCETEVLDVKPSKSKPDRGVVKVHTRVLNQDGTLVAEFKRLVLVPRKNRQKKKKKKMAQAAAG